jgi:hypothetical protein
MSTTLFSKSKKKNIMSSFKFVVVPANLDADEHDFFEYNPELRYIDPITRLVDQRGQEVASKVMWATYLSEDPDSKFYAMRLEERRYQIAKNFLKAIDFDWESYKYVIDAYPDIAMSPKKRRFQRLNSKFEQMLNEIEGNDLKVSIMFYSKLEAIYKGLQRAETAYEEEKSKTVETRGQQQSGYFGQRNQ